MKEYCEKIALDAWLELSSSNLVTAEKLSKVPEIRFTNLGDKFLGRAYSDHIELNEKFLLEHQGKFADKCDLSTIPSDDWWRILLKQPQLAELCPAWDFRLDDWADLLKAQPHFFKRCGNICCGRPMWMAGRFEQSKQMIEKNTEIIKASGATTLLLSCPICYKIFKERYNLEGIEVIHHTEFIDRLITQGRISVRRAGTSFVYHDPCELGRGCGIYEEPRRAIGSIGNLVEAGKTRKESICCGGSLGSLSLSFAKRKTLTENALHDLTVASPDIIVTACPLCRSTFGRYADRPVKDIAEIIVENIN